MQIELHDEREAAVRDALASGRWPSAEDFIGELVDEFRERAWAQEHREELERLVAEAYASGPGRETTPEEMGEFMRGVLTRIRVAG